MAQKLQKIKDAARAQEPVVPTIPQKSIVASVQDGKPIERETLTFSKETQGGKSKFGKVDDDAKSVAGRKRILKGGETKDLHSGKEAPMAIEREKAKYPAGKKSEKEEKEGSREDHELEMELNSILKKGPSTSKSKGCLLSRQDHSS